MIHPLTNPNARQIFQEEGHTGVQFKRRLLFRNKFRDRFRRDNLSTEVSSESWAKLRDWASVAAKGRLLLSGSVAHASLKTAVDTFLTSLRKG